MVEVTFVRESNEFDELLKKILQESNSGLVVKENLSSSLVKGPIIVHLNFENIKRFLTLIDDRHEKVIIAFQDKNSFKLMDQLKMHLDKVFGFLDLSLDYEYNVPLVKNYLNQNYSTSLLGLEKLSQDLEKILEFTQTELSRVKEMHDRFVKLRTETLRGAQVQIKFMAGEKSGGEFFDFIEKDHHIVIIEAGTDSYVTSSMIISEVESLKAFSGDTINELPKFIKKLVHIADEYKAKLNYLITIYNTTTLEVTYFQRGNSRVYFDRQVRNISGEGKFKLNRGEKLFFLSEGLMRNWNLHNKESELQDFLNQHLELSTKDFINELFFDLVKHKNSTFLMYDALMGVIEISQNVIHKV